MPERSRVADLTPRTLGGVRCLTRTGGVKGGVRSGASLPADSSLSECNEPSGSLKASGTGRISGSWTTGAVTVTGGKAAAGDWRGAEAEDWTEDGEWRWTEA